MFSKIISLVFAFAAIHGVYANASPDDDTIQRRSLVYSYDPNQSIYIEPGLFSSSVVGSYASVSAVPSASGGGYYSSVGSYWNSYSESAQPSYGAQSSYGRQSSYGAQPSIPAQSSAGGGRPGHSRGPGDNSHHRPQNSRSVGAGPASSSTAASPAPAPGAASTHSSLGCAVIIGLAALTGVLAILL